MKERHTQNQNISTPNQTTAPERRSQSRASRRTMVGLGAAGLAVAVTGGVAFANSMNHNTNPGRAAADTESAQPSVERTVPSTAPSSTVPARTSEKSHPTTANTISASPSELPQSTTSVPVQTETSSTSHAPTKTPTRTTQAPKPTESASVTPEQSAFDQAWSTYMADFASAARDEYGKQYDDLLVQNDDKNWSIDYTRNVEAEDGSTDTYHVVVGLRNPSGNSLPDNITQFSITQEKGGEIVKDVSIACENGVDCVVQNTIGGEQLDPANPDDELRVRGEASLMLDAIRTA